MSNRSRLSSTLYLTDGATRGHAPTYSETAQSLVGRPRVAWELAHGASAVPGETPAIPLNPQGQYGVDMSGPPFGPCLLMHVASFGLTPTGNVIAPTHPWGAIDSVIPRRQGAFPFRFFNRFHAIREDGLAPLQRLSVTLRRSATGGSGTTELVCRVQSRTTGDDKAIIVNISTDAAGDVTIAQITCAPGINELDITLARLSGTRTVQIHGVMLHVAAKRRHGLSFPG
jgi:hypothetical protein